MSTRTIVGTLKDGQGTTLTDVTLEFTPVDVMGSPVDFFDSEAGWRGGKTVTVRSDINGAFSVALECTSTALAIPDTPGGVYWKCHVQPINGAKLFRDFKAPLDDGITDLDFMDFRAAGSLLTAPGQSIFSSHTNNAALHSIIEYFRATGLPTGRKYRLRLYDDGVLEQEEIV